MLRRLIIATRRQFLLWQLRGAQGWLGEYRMAEQLSRIAQFNKRQEIDRMKAQLAKLDGNEMLMGEARVIVR